MACLAPLLLLDTHEKTPASFEFHVLFIGRNPAVKFCHY